MLDDIKGFLFVFLVVEVELCKWSCVSSTTGTMVMGSCECSYLKVELCK